MKTTVLGCNHGHLPKLRGGDLLILTGDYTKSNKMGQWVDFFKWVKKQKYRKKVLIGGNHDNFFMTGWPKTQEEADNLKEVEKIQHEKEKENLYDFDYLCDSGIEFEGLKIWGTPWVKSFKGMNPHCKAFTLNTEDEMMGKFNFIPKDTDILVSHSPPFLILDQNYKGQPCGSVALRESIDRVRPRFSLFSHIHEDGGKVMIYKNPGKDTICYNVAVMDEKYEPFDNRICYLEI